MTREVDLRDFEVDRITPAREEELQDSASESSSLLPGDQAVTIESLDPITGNPSNVAVSGGPAERGNYVQRALDHVQAADSILGLAPTQPTEFAADPHVQQTSSGAATVHLQQQYKGIPIFDATLAVRFEPDGSLRETAGTTITVSQDRPLSAQLSVTDAVMRAAQHVAEPTLDEKGAVDQFGEPLPAQAVNVSSFEPEVVATFPEQANSPTVLAAGPFGDRIKASLIWFPLNEDLRLAWDVITAMPGYQGMYRTVVDAESGEILYCHQKVEAVAARGNVYHVNGGTARQMTNFPRTLSDYGLPNPPPGRPLPGGFPDTWVETNRTVGNAVNAHQGDTGPTFQGTADQTGLMTFNPANATASDQQVLNIFYYNGYMHDYFYLLGFREDDGNFQQSNFNRGGAQTDRVDARAHPGAVWGTANMLTRIDGQGPTMNMGLVTSTNRHTAFDSDVVFHEFMHGVTNRLVGGPLNVNALDAPQSGGMGEGWGDYVACLINNVTVVGAWVVNRAGGIRGFPYDSAFPDNFGDLGTGRYTQVHNIGEIWCATLMEMTRNIGKVLAIQLVVDALKLSPANPSFLDMRDAILRALDDKLRAGQVNSSDHATAYRGIWEAFAMFGMGPGASSNDAQLSGIVADFTTGLPPSGDALIEAVLHVMMQ